MDEGTMFWNCASCGEENEGDGDICWKCQFVRTGGAIQTNTVSEVDLVNEILRKQSEQGESLRQMSSQVGCMYNYLWFSIIVGIIYLFYLLNSQPQLRSYPYWR